MRKINVIIAERIEAEVARILRETSLDEEQARLLAVGLVEGPKTEAGKAVYDRQLSEAVALAKERL